jgi:anti-sigma B factor antagonist
MALHLATAESKPCMFTLTLTGALDNNTHADLEKRIDYLIAEGGAKVITLDMAKLDFLSSMGVRAVFKAKRDLARINGKLLMVNLPPQIQKVFEIINAIPSMQIFSSIEELDEYLTRMQASVSDAP